MGAEFVKRADREYQGERPFRALVDGAFDIQFRMSPDWSELRELKGRNLLPDSQKADRRWVQHYVDPQDQPAVQREVQRAVTTRTPFHLEHRIRRADGTQAWVSSRAVPLCNPEGEIEEWFGAAIDITSRRRIEEALRRSEEGFRAIIETTPECVKVVDAGGILLHMNSVGLVLVGADYAESVVGKSVYDLIAAEDRERFRAFNERICRGEKGTLEFDIVGLKGTRRRMETHAAPLQYGDGRVVQLAVTRDISKRKEAEIAQRRLAAIVESSDDAIVSKDLKGIVTSWNACAERMFGYTAQEIIGRPITTIIPPELHGDETRILATIARGERIEHFETVRVRKNGEPIEVSLTVSPLKDENGNIVGAAKIARDITQRKKTETALRTSERLASVGRLAATVAHEINNPLEGVINLVYLAKGSESIEDIRDYLGRAEQELDRIAHLTKQTLGFYRETKGAANIRLGSLVTSVLSVYSSKALKRGIHLHSQILSDPEIYAIPGEIRQVISNLVGNSIDALNTPGEICVRVSSSVLWNGTCRRGIRLTIGDTGVGIPVEARPKLFEPFFTTKRDVGTGLGLWVCKNIVEKHDGRIQVRSSAEPGRSWTVFSIFLPLRPDNVGGDQSSISV